MLSLLEIVDNPRQDVPLISVLRSPLFGFTADRLAEGRSAGYRPAGYSRVTTGGCDDPCTRLCGTMLCCNLLGGGGYFCCI